MFVVFAVTPEIAFALAARSGWSILVVFYCITVVNGSSMFSSIYIFLMTRVRSSFLILAV